ncbi:GA module-containing protein, partial [Staphylococcus aureus]|uniref:GA module-containing protein n=1 Tax=Staphylococcus aureus TaxID=1280 RepID=UPI0011A083EF
TPHVLLTPTQITPPLNKLTQPKNHLNPNTNLPTPKQNLQHPIHQFPNLNQPQPHQYTKQITQPTLLPNLNPIQQPPTTLNHPITQFKQPIPHKPQIKPTQNYHHPHPHNQTPYHNA